MTPETFEAEFVAYNDFRRACGLIPYDRTQFAATVARHNATLHRERGVLTALIDNDIPEA